MEHNHHDEHVRFYATKTFRLLCMLSLTFSFFIVELVVGNVTNSLALVADAFHMLSDVIALIIALVAVRISTRRSDVNTYGWVRAEVVGANVNTVFLLALSLTIVFDVVKRYLTPEPIENVNLLLIVGSTGLGINIIGLFLFQGFHGHSHAGSGGHHSHHNQDASPTSTENISVQSNSANDSIEALDTIPGTSDFKRHSTRALEEVIIDCAENAHQNATSTSPVPPKVTSKPQKRSKPAKTASMNMHGVFLHVLADALGSIVVIISALLIKFVPHDPHNLKHWTTYIDPTLSLIIVIIITISALPLLKETSLILLQTLPNHIKVDEVKKKLLKEVPEIDGIHELHIWRLTDQKVIASAHLKRRSLAGYMQVADKVKHFFHSIGIHSTTIQYEHEEDERETAPLQLRRERVDSSVKRGCLLRCEGDSCDTLACCTEASMQSTLQPDHTNSSTDSQQHDGRSASQPTQPIHIALPVVSETSQT